MIILPIPPSINHLYGRNGWRTYITPKGQTWFEEAGWKLKSQWHKKIILNNISLYLKLYHARRYDYDNCLKATNDLLTKIGVIKDDSQITFAQIEKIKVKHRKDERITLDIEG